MTLLAVYTDPDTDPELVRDFHGIAATLGALGVVFERWDTSGAPARDAAPEDILAAYRDSVERLNTRFGFRSADVVSLTPDHPQKDEFRNKFLAEHVHSDFEVRFFVDGQGLFYIHADDRVYLVLCRKGDLISVPADTPHWFDMGASPSFQCIRLFTTPDGWVADFTGSDIARQYPDLDTFVRSFDQAPA
jgi:1,2-dihydroxy-3-keto-5-methylthiopentene dioxygenase